MGDPIIKATACTLVHVPGFVRYGSKPTREIAAGGDRVLAAIEAHLRSFRDAVEYPPNQVFIGNLHPDRLNHFETPWTTHPINGAPASGPFGEIIPEQTFIGMLKIADEFDLVWLDREATSGFLAALEESPFRGLSDLETRLLPGIDIERIRERISSQGSLPLYHDGRLVGCIHRHHEQDESLTAPVLLENLMTKTSGALALQQLMARANCTPEAVDFILSCSEEAVGDRYNRGGGSLAKAIGEMCGCVQATGCDIKAFCVGPVYAIVLAASLVKAGIFKRIAVVGGGCLAKLGMKFLGHVANDMPILEDVLGAVAFLVTEDDGENPVIRLDSIGKHTIGSGSSQQNIMEALVLNPLDRVGKKVCDVDKYATELHNPEVTVPSGSGNVPLNNYRMIAALAVLRREIDRSGIDAFVVRRGMPGFAPTQGHIPAAVPFLGHAIADIKAGRIESAMFLAKGSLFLGRMSQLSDGLSFLLQKNPNAR